MWEVLSFKKKEKKKKKEEEKKKKWRENVKQGKKIFKYIRDYQRENIGRE